MTLPISPTSKFNYPWAKLFIATGLACVVNLAAWANTALPTGIVKSLGLEGFKTIRLVGEDGKTLTVDEFNTRVAARQPFDMRKNPETSTATLTFNGNTPPAAINTIGLKVGSAMPALKLTDTQGRVRTWDEFGDKPVLLNFFFADCPPCIQEIPALNAFTKSNPHVAVLSVTFESSAVAQKFITRHGLLWPAVADGQDFIKALGVKSYPTLLLVSPKRNLLAVKTGGILPPEDGSGYVFSLDVWVRQNLK